MEWIKNDTMIVTASGDKTCKIIDVESGVDVACLGRQNGDNGHLGSVKCIQRIDYEGNIIASGGRDGKIILHDARIPNGYAATIQDSHISEYSSTQ